MARPEKPPKRTVVQEFREFAVKGNVMDLAVGVIIGAAFGKIVQSLVNDMILPPIGAVVGKIDFGNMFVVLTPPDPKKMEEAIKANKAVKLVTPADYTNFGGVTLNYGAFLNNVIQFLIVAFVVFLLVRAINRLRDHLSPLPATGPISRECPFCLSDIPVGASKCAHCTSEVPPLAPTSA